MNKFLLMGKVSSLLLASAEDCAGIVECLDCDGAITIEEFRLMADLLWIEPRLARGVHLCTELDNNQVRAFFFEKKEFSANNQVRVHLRSSLD